MSTLPDCAQPAPCASLRLLALETSTHSLSLALGSGSPGGPLWQRSGAGGAQASGSVLALVDELLAQAGWPLAGLDALVFGRGPGSFTGLRTACAVAQGLAYGAQLPVLALDTLLALAEQARWLQEQAGQPAPPLIVALLDARMGQLYAAPYANGTPGLQPLAAPFLCAPHKLGAHLAQRLPGVALHPDAPVLLAGNVFEAYGAALAGLPAARLCALPCASALLRLAPALLAAGAAVAPAQALPLYVRDQVALTTAEREHLRTAGAALPA